MNSLRAELMKKETSARVIFYDPSGCGGVCQYTYYLAESLARLGNDITVVTTEGYELKHLERHFRLKFLFKKSWVKTVLFKLMPSLQPATPSNGRMPIANKGGSAGDHTNRTGAVLKVLRTMRVRLMTLRAAFSFFVTRSRVVHVQWLADRQEDCFFLQLLKRLGFKIVYTAHDLLPPNGCSPRDRKALERIYQVVDSIIVHSENNKREMITLLGIDSNKISVIPIGSYDFLRNEKDLTQEKAREGLGIPSGKKVILFFGLIRRYKGLEYLVEAFRHVQAHLDDAMLLVVGNIYAEDLEGFRYYSRLIEELRARGDTMCVSEYVPLEKVSSYFAAADLVALPYTKSYTSAILLAAYAAGRPVIVTDTGALSEIVEEGKSGMIVPPRDAKALAKGIIKIFQTPNKMREMGNHARHLAETTYSWEGIASRTISLYQRL